MGRAGGEASAAAGLAANAKRRSVRSGSGYLCYAAFFCLPRTGLSKGCTEETLTR